MGDHLDRRGFLKFGAGVVVGALATASTDQIIDATSGLERSLRDRDFSVEGSQSLQARARDKNLIFGASTTARPIREDAVYAQRFAQECAMLVPANELKWQALRPTPTTYNYERGDRLIHFAQKHNMMLRGHTLVWHQGLPPWFKDTVHANNAERFMADHIQTVVSRYAGQMHSWDVVNEAIAPGQGQARGLRNTPWLRLMGESYIEKAFRLAHEADPKALLFYNDFNLDFANPKDEKKRVAVLQLIERLLDKGVPIHGLGTQAHLNAAKLQQIHAGKLRQYFGRIARLGLKVMVTELDVIDQQLPRDIDLRDRYVAATYEDYLTILLQEAAVIGVITWGLSDRYTWLSGEKPRRDGLPVRPLPYDQNHRPKLAWNAIARAIAQAPPRQVSQS
ncbi:MULTISPECIES: endo-1,4-beta-xylanase [unclassified Leptolyngbya]|uniref:endo-1,4-beta-xylanase n=1 Tax=unclassified Leptolyngbya TaxID=2650499 RepID=UPI001683D6C2|nr:MULTISPECIES: endo-1,4-beta-xylanase [unclassified Leptolyngbya]MBD1911588.1 endo-1,4-beta-xylanase [Leptolyngbya sp. FACHB-8]MBD2157852.1 endo-1,4-beta-xylanase [Leptolyngbya sp. FACHB-16]